MAVAVNTGWKDIFTSRADGHGFVVIVSKAFIRAKAEYTVRFGVEKKDESGTYMSVNIPFETVSMDTFTRL